MLTYDHVQAYDRDGFALVENMFTQEEMDILLSHVDQSGRVTQHTFNMPDTGGRSSKLSLWVDLGEDVFGVVSASPRIVNGARMLAREDVYHWHSKVMLKEPRVGGAWEWHQDYGYWYFDGCPYPRLISCMIALNPASRENGCLKVLVGSHLLGRLEHGRQGKQSGAEPARVAELEKKLKVHYVEAPAGSGLFFHCNTLHSSEPNLSDRPRLAYICCYNTFSNIPILGKGHGKPLPIRLAPDDAILHFAPRPAAVAVESS